jgi:hypothetical protein
VDIDTSAALTATACDTRSGEVCLDLVGSFHAMASQFEATFYDHGTMQTLLSAKTHTSPVPAVPLRHLRRTPQQ